MMKHICMAVPALFLALSVWAHIPTSSAPPVISTRDSLPSKTSSVISVGETKLLPFSPSPMNSVPSASLMV